MIYLIILFQSYWNFLIKERMYRKVFLLNICKSLAGTETETGARSFQTHQCNAKNIRSEKQKWKRRN